MKKALYFFQYLPPWRIDVFNGMAKEYDLTVVFFNADAEGFSYNRKALLSRLQDVGTEFMTTGFRIKDRPVRFGVSKLIRKYAPEVVYVHEYSPVSMELALLKRRFGYRLYVTTSDNLAMARSVLGLKEWARRMVLRHADGIVLYSRAVEAFYRERFPGLKTAVCPNIQRPETLLAFRDAFPAIAEADEAGFRLDGKRVVLYVGRLVPVKGLDLLLPAFARMAPADAVLVLVGEGECRILLESQAGELGILDRIRWVGYRDGTGLYAWYDRADFMVLPSRYEPFGAVVNEALVFGCPVVVSDRIGALDFVDGKNGIVFDPLDPQGFDQALGDAFDRFRGRGPRENLMPCAFDEYLQQLIDIDKDD